MLDLTLTAGAAAIKYLFPRDGSTTPNGTTDPHASVEKWNPEGPSILTSLWMLTLLPHGTKLHFDTHNVYPDVPGDGILPQWFNRGFRTGDNRGDLKKLILAVKIAINICPPTKTAEKDVEKMPSINKHYLGAREGLLQLANTYGYKIDLEEFRTQKMENSLLLTPKPKKDKKDKNYRPRKAITKCINYIDDALETGFKEGQLPELAMRVRENWKQENFDAIAHYMKEAKLKLQKNPNSKDCPCKNELQIVQGMINAKVEDFARFTLECSSHKFIRSVSEPPPRPAAAEPHSPPPPKLSLSNVKQEDDD